MFDMLISTDIQCSTTCYVRKQKNIYIYKDKYILLRGIEGNMEKLLHECVDCIARAEGEGNASTDECNIFSYCSLSHAISCLL